MFPNALRKPIIFAFQSSPSNSPLEVEEEGNDELVSGKVLTVSVAVLASVTGVIGLPEFGNAELPGVFTAKHNNKHIEMFGISQFLSCSSFFVF